MPTRWKDFHEKNSYRDPSEPSQEGRPFDLTFRQQLERKKLPPGFHEMAVTDPTRADDPARTRRLYFEVNATMLGSLTGGAPETWLDEYYLYVREKREGQVKTITEYARKHPGGQVKEPTGRFFDVARWLEERNGGDGRQEDAP